MPKVIILKSLNYLFERAESPRVIIVSFLGYAVSASDGFVA